jgi:serine/threonine protein kinase
VVHAATWQGQKAALKLYRCTDDGIGEAERTWKIFLKEAQMLQQWDSPRLVKFFGVFIGGDGCPCLVTELLEGGTLHELLHGRRKPQKPLLEPVHRFLLATHIAEGVAYLHSRKLPVVHRDLKSKNVVIATKMPGAGPPCAAKIIDYGLADYVCAVDDQRESMVTVGHGMQGSAVYMAPECFVEPFYLSVKVDVWALGCVLAEIFGGAPPHLECEDLSQVIEKLLVQRQGPDVPAHADLASGAPGDNSIQCVLEACFAFNADERWSAAKVLERLQGLAVERGFELLESSRL